jgi:hypothetical protein
MKLTKLDMLISAIYFLIILFLFITDNFTFKVFIIATIIYSVISFSLSFIRGKKDYNKDTGK